jgi:hypothetical protein
MRRRRPFAEHRCGYGSYGYNRYKNALQQWPEEHVELLIEIAESALRDVTYREELCDDLDLSESEALDLLNKIIAMG